jgi:hypothetical protein
MMRAVPLLFGIFSVPVVAQPPGHLRGARPTTDEECKAVPGINTALPIVFDDTCPGKCCFEDKPCRYCNEGCEGQGACAAATPAPTEDRLPACFGFPYVDNDCGHSSLGCYPDLRCLDAATYGCTEDSVNYPDWEVCKVCAKPGDANAAGYDECPTEPVKPGPSLPACFGFPYVDNNCGHSSLGCYPDLRCLDAATYGCTEDSVNHPDWEVCKVCAKPGDANAAGYDECPTEPVQPLPAL